MGEDTHSPETAVFGFVGSYFKDDYSYVIALVVIGVAALIIRRILSKLADDVYDSAKDRTLRVLGLRRKPPELVQATVIVERQSPAIQPKPSVVLKADEDSSTPGVFKTSRDAYKIDSLLADGDIARVYTGSYHPPRQGTAPILVKVAKNPADNDLMINEVRTLAALHEGDAEYRRHLALVHDQFKTKVGQYATVMQRFENSFDLVAVREAYPSGIPQRHIIWIFRRTLSVLGYAHSKGFIHGNINPTHILVHPPDHNVFLVDWCYSVLKPSETGERFLCLNEIYSPPEVGERRPPIPSSDLYSLGKCMIYLLGGDPVKLTFPNDVDERLQRFILFFTRESPVGRAQDAWQMYTELDALREEIFGPHKFIEFDMSGRKGG